MDLKVDGAGLDNIGGQCMVEGKQWANVNVGFTDQDTEHHHSVDIRVLVAAGLDVTLRQLQEEARGSALNILQAAVKVLETQQIYELSKAEKDRESVERDQSEAALQDLLSRPV